MPYHFEYADKAHLQTILPLCFQILHFNMEQIAPTGNTHEEAYVMWYSEVFPAMQKEPRQMVLMYEADEVVGFFQYYVFRGAFMMEEIQIKPEHQGTGLFRALYLWLFDRLEKEIDFVEAYSHRNNLKSQGILEHLGLEPCVESKDGRCIYYKGTYADLVKACAGGKTVFPTVG